jgi:hypothetical protein
MDGGPSHNALTAVSWVCLLRHHIDTPLHSARPCGIPIPGFLFQGAKVANTICSLCMRCANHPHVIFPDGLGRYLGWRTNIFFFLRVLDSQRTQRLSHSSRIEYCGMYATELLFLRICVLTIRTPAPVRLSLRAQAGKMAVDYEVKHPAVPAALQRGIAIVIF